MIPLDNNTAERALRNPVKGRDNYNGYMSINGADTAMFFYTIIECCKLITDDLSTVTIKAMPR
jgi:transposase